MRRWMVIAALAAAPVVAAAARPRALAVQPGSRVWVAGGSTFSLWRCESAEPRGSAAAETTDPARIAAVPRAEIVIPVATLDCRGETMTRQMWSAMKIDVAPEIRFRARSVRLEPSAGSRWTATLEGPLEFAGESHPVRVAAEVVEEGGSLRVRGSTGLVMTEWGIAVPTLMRSIEVDPQVTVGFDVLLKP